MVTWQNTLNAYHDFELLTQQKIGRRKWKWLRKRDDLGQAARVLRLLLAKRLRQIAERLEAEALRFGQTSAVKLVSATNVSPLLSEKTLKISPSVLIETSAERIYSQSLSK